MDMAAKESNHPIGGSIADALNAGFREGAVDDAEQLVKAPAHQSAAMDATARDRFQRVLARAKLKLVDAQSQLADKARQTTEVTQRYVVVHPWKSLTLVGSIGVIVGVLVSRRS